jgi:hypothetical protein
MLVGEGTPAEPAGESVGEVAGEEVQATARANVATPINSAPNDGRISESFSLIVASFHLLPFSLPIGT